MKRYNAICRIDGCSRFMREDDVVCKPHYLMLPRELRRLIWSEDAGDITMALTLIDEEARRREVR